ncbi:conserved hypothetical protein [Planctopirus limnophila DSM 3776]|uniref:ATP-binding protein n=1 Tax=Planctopirus limnophila (strain ATCC 43296 / DSM 3776 / IFAM 1008 / Mu 290) TaxID=521674 RepID=D5STS9_PLAL2|nr:ATP-binding protein [Planctopirus limnophila]ADG66914.1 conserved hypothetical protein [Planctopirus limnophila DSM 3776]
MTIPARERTAIIQSLAAGVVPGIGLHHIQVGRNDEVQALVRDLEQVGQGGAACRFIIGRFGSGKTFFLNLLRTVALQRKFVVAQADITTERRLHGSNGQARSLYAELIKNLSTRSKPDGGALPNLVQRWVGDVDHEVREDGGDDEGVRRELLKRLQPLQELVSGYDFANVIVKYFEGFLTHNEVQQQAALRWLRGEYATKTEARQDLGVRSIIEDDSFYDYLKLLAAFVRMAGFAGLLVNVDELVVLSHRLNNTVARNNNYEAILRIVNDSLQGRASGIGFVFAGTPECLEDRRRGIFSYEALATRLAANRFASEGLRDLNAPVVHLESLTAEDCYVLLDNIRNVFDGGDLAKRLLPDEGIVRYLEVCQQRMGSSYFQTPRDTVKDFVGLMQVLQQNPTASWEQLLSIKQAESFVPTTDEMNLDTAREENSENLPKNSDDLTTFRL